MESQRYALKLFVSPPCDVPGKDFILFFHRLIQENALAETTIDVTDYSHVPNGPGVMLICHEVHYAWDQAGGRLGLKCAQKRGASGDTAARIQSITSRVLRLAALVEGHEIFGGRLRFDTSSALYSVEDRLLAPNTQETFEVFAPVLAGVATRVWGAPPVLVRAGSDKECFQVELSAPQAPPIADLLARSQ